MAALHSAGMSLPGMADQGQNGSVLSLLMGDNVQEKSACQIDANGGYRQGEGRGLERVATKGGARAMLLRAIVHNVSTNFWEVDFVEYTTQKIEHRFTSKIEHFHAPRF